jgi:Tol biopolymer transport system component
VTRGRLARRNLAIVAVALAVIAAMTPTWLGRAMSQEKTSPQRDRPDNPSRLELVDFVWAIDSGVWVADAVGGRARQVSTDGRIANTVWSPDESVLAFSADLDDSGDSDLYTLDVKSGAVERITDDPRNEIEPDWSPSGESLVYEVFDDDGFSELAVVDVATRTSRSLTSAGGLNVQPSWSPSGEEIVFTRNVKGNIDLWKVPAVGGEILRITEDIGDESTPDWAPDGRIVYLKRKTSDETGDIWLVSADGKSSEPLVTTDSLEEYAPTLIDSQTLAYIRVDFKSPEVLVLLNLDTGAELIVADSVGATFDWTER